MNSINPLSILDSILADYLPPKGRRLVHSLIALGVFVFGIYEAAGGDWDKAIPGLLVALYAAANKANTAPVEDAAPADEPTDDLSYEEAGGLPMPDADSPAAPPLDPATPPLHD